MTTKYVIKKSEAILIQENPYSSFLEYHLPFKSVSMGISKIHGRYPTTGFDIDLAVEQVWFAKSGVGEINISGDIVEVGEGDMILIPKGIKYQILGNKLELVVSSSPAWYPEQHKHVD